MAVVADGQMDVIIKCINKSVKVCWCSASCNINCLCSVQLMPWCACSHASWPRLFDDHYRRDFSLIKSDQIKMNCFKFELNGDEEIMMIIKIYCVPGGVSQSSPP